MIDIGMINVGNKCYNVKTKIYFGEDRDTLVITILNVDEVIKTGPTSYSNIRTIFSKTSNSTFNTIQYKEIFSKITNKLSQKYGCKNIQFY